MPLFPAPPPHTVKAEPGEQIESCQDSQATRGASGHTHPLCGVRPLTWVRHSLCPPHALGWGRKTGLTTVQRNECCRPRRNTKGRAPCLRERQGGLPREVRLDLGLEQGPQPNPTPTPGGHGPGPGLRLLGTSRSFICRFPTTRNTT